MKGGYYFDIHHSIFDVHYLFNGSGAIRGISVVLRSFRLSKLVPGALGKGHALGYQAIVAAAYLLNTDLVVGPALNGGGVVGAALLVDSHLVAQ